MTHHPPTKILNLTNHDLSRNMVWKKWHEAMELSFSGRRDKAALILSEIFDDNIAFLPPTYAKSRVGKLFAMKAIEGVTHLFKDFRYTREFVSDRDFALEFVCKVGEYTLWGADMIKLNEKGDKIIEFMVLARPPSAVQKILEHQTEFLKPFMAQLGGGEKSKGKVRNTTKVDNSVTTKQSMAVLKNCVRLGLSTIAYARELFPPAAFVTKSYAGVNLMVLQAMNENGEVQSHDALQLQQWLESGAFDALQQGYLSRIILQILDGHPSEPSSRLLESYTFAITPDATDKEKTTVEVKSTNGSRTSTSSNTVTSRDEIHAAVQKMIKTLVILTSSLQSLPNERYVSMALAFNDNAPANYQPEHFCGIDNLPRFALEPLVIPLGTVKTGFHAMDLEFRHAEDELNAMTEKLIEEAPTQQLDQGDDDVGYDSDSTDVKWETKKMELLQEMSKIAASAPDPSMAALTIRMSNLALTLEPAVLDDLLGQLNLKEDLKSSNKKTSSTKPVKGKGRSKSPIASPPAPQVTIIPSGEGKLSRVKRPIHQITKPVKKASSPQPPQQQSVVAQQDNRGDVHSSQGSLNKIDMDGDVMVMVPETQFASTSSATTTQEAANNTIKGRVATYKRKRT